MGQTGSSDSKVTPLDVCSCCNQNSASRLREGLHEDNVDDRIKMAGGEKIEFSKTANSWSREEDGTQIVVGKSDKVDDEDVRDILPYFGADLPELRAMSRGVRPAPKADVEHKFISSGAIYTGQWKGYARDGLGKQVWSDGTMYIGQWVNSLPDGRGRHMNSHGDEFIGVWSRGVAHGMGVFRSASGSPCYEGEWQGDLQHGCGKECWGDGSSYLGQFVYGKKVGYGVYTKMNGDTFNGHWDSNVSSGPGQFIAVDGEEVSGYWREHQIQGYGKYRWSSGDAYCGQFREDLRDGFGVFTWKNGCRFEGWWERGERRNGKDIFPSGSCRKVGNA